MSYLMMQVTAWDSSIEINTDEVKKAFNLVSGDLDESYGAISLSATQDALVVMASVEGAKKMLAQHVDNTFAGKGPFVEGPFSNPQIQPFGG